MLGFAALTPLHRVRGCYRFVQPMHSEPFVMRPARVGKALLEGGEFVVARPVRRETGRAFDRGIPVRRPHAICSTRAGWPAQHAFAEGNAELGAQRAQGSARILQDVGGIEHGWRMAELVADVVEQSRLLFEAEFPRR